MNEVKGKSFLVTGGAGFIGSHLVEALIENGAYVRVLDNLCGGKVENISSYLNHPSFQFIEGDIRNLPTCKRACEKIDYVLHQAALGSVPRSFLYPELYEDVNSRGTLNMLIAAKEQGVKRFVYASSSSVYGDEKTLPKKEEKVGNALSPYAITKKVNEYYALLYQRSLGLETIGLRYFNVFGPRQNPEGNYAAVIPKFITNSLSNTQVVINGDGVHSRDFTYVKNVVNANILACFSSKEATGHIYNIGVGKAASLNEVCGIIGDYLKKEIIPIYGPHRKGDVVHSLACIDKASKLLNYKPVYFFQEGMEKTISYFKQQK